MFIEDYLWWYVWAGGGDLVGGCRTSPHKHGTLPSALAPLPFQGLADAWWEPPVTAKWE